MYKLLIPAFICLICCSAYQSLHAAASASENTTGVHPGKAIYDEYCLTCHQADGKGVPGMNPPLVKTDWVLGDKNRLITVLLKGLKTPVTINGQTYRNPMPSHDFLSDTEIAHVLTYIRSSFGNKASVVTPEEVTIVRAAK